MAGTQFTVHDLGQRSRGDMVEITLQGSAANVRLMDSSNLSKYKRGASHHYSGGLAKKSPVVLAIPRSGHWYVTVDLIGLKGRVKSSARILPQPLPPLRQSLDPLRSVGIIQQQAALSSLYVDRESAKTYDLFISHASEDKDEVVRPLAHALRENGVRVWYDEFELRIGDSLRQKIDQGLVNSRAGLAVLSHDFFAKGWPNYELDGLVTNNVAGKQKLLPIWHGLTKENVLEYSPSLADKVALRTESSSLVEMAAEIASVVKGEALPLHDLSQLHEEMPESFG